MNTVTLKNISLRGQTGKLINNIIDNWLKGIRESNPAILDMFADRDLKPYRQALPWSGEFAGKYITGAYYTYKLTQNQHLYDYITNFIDEMITYQDSDGYLGCFSKECHLTGARSETPDKIGNSWDAWNHYHVMYGLLLWYDLTKNGAYFSVAEKIAEMFMNKFYDGNPPLVSIGSTDKNLAPYHIFGILYRKTKKEKYLTFAQKIENDLSDETAGNYIYYSQEGYEFYECPRPRWESMHIIMGIAEMYRNTLDEKYLDVTSQIFYSILKTDVHNSGAFSSEEMAIGTPYKNQRIETCCVIAYNALAIELFLLNSDLKIIDFLERSHYNAVLGYYSPTGRWSTYDTPMEGTKYANFHSINFQCRPGAPELNCCSVNAPRGVANVSEWLVTEDEKGLYLNFYEDAEFETKSGVVFKISGQYPAANNIKISIDSTGNKEKIFFRIPGWSKNTTVKIDNDIFYPECGTYISFDRIWNDTVCITFDFTPYTEDGGEEYTGKSSIYVGPVLYGLDHHDNPGIDFSEPPALSLEELRGLRPILNKNGSISLTFSSGIILKDFCHLGISGSSYKTWMKLK